MKKIETYEQLLDWAKRANTPLTTKQRCDMQDEFMHTDLNTMKGFVEEACNHTDKYDRRNILFGIMKLLSDETLATYIGVWARTVYERQREIDEKDLIKRWNDLEEANRRLTIKKQIFEDSKKPIHKRIRALRKEIERLKQANSWLEKNRDNFENLYHELQCQLREDQQAASHLRRIKSILGRAA